MFVFPLCRILLYKKKIDKVARLAEASYCFVTAKSSERTKEKRKKERKKLGTSLAPEQRTVREICQCHCLYFILVKSLNHHRFLCHHIEVVGNCVHKKFLFGHLKQLCTRSFERIGNDGRK